MDTIYQAARKLMQEEIRRYLELSEATDGFRSVEPEHLEDEDTCYMFAAGLGLSPKGREAESLVREWERRQAVPFDTEAAVTFGVYRRLRPYGGELFDKAAEATDGFTAFDASVLHTNPELLPILQHVAGVFSKAALKKLVGQVADSGLSRPAAARVAELLERRVKAPEVSRENVLQRLEATLEGIVRDLVGRVLLESVVATALEREGVPHLREEEYASLSGGMCPVSCGNSILA